MTPFSTFVNTWDPDSFMGSSQEGGVFEEDIQDDIQLGQLLERILEE